MINSEIQLGKTCELINILQELEEPGLSPLDLKTRGNRMKEIYISKSGELYRHSYSEITEYMYSHHVIDEIPSPDPGSTIIDNLRLIQEDWETDKESEEKDKLCSSLQKLIDHVSLEVVRLGQMADIYYKLMMKDKINQRMQEAKEKMDKVADSLKEQEILVEKVGRDIENRRHEVEEIQIDVKNHNTQSITVLSIFACVVFAFTGGFSLITGALSILPNITTEKTPLLVGTLLMLSTVLVDTIYMLLRAARHYSHDSQGHLKGFFICNLIAVLFSLFLLLFYYLNKSI